MEFSLHYTGFLPGETIVAHSKKDNVQGSSMTVLDPFPPFLTALEQLKEQEWKHLEAFMQRRPHFKSMSGKEIRSWLLRNAINKKNFYISDANVNVTDVTLAGKDFISGLTPEQITMFGSSNWTVKQIYNSIAKKSETTKAFHHSLVWRPNLWKVSVEVGNTMESYEGWAISLDSGELKNGSWISSSELNIMLLAGSQYAVLFTPSQPITLPMLHTIIEQLIDTKEDLDKLSEMLKWATPAVFKSLIQKIIRTGCESVTYDSVKYDSDVFLLLGYALLLLEPGNYDEQLHLFISGAESAMKRSAISICEDSFTEDSNALLSMFAGALVQKQNRGKWFPSVKMITLHMRTLLNARKSTKIYKYSTKSDCTIEGNGPLDACYELLCELKSFNTDINMVSWIAKNGGSTESYTAKSFVSNMPFIHVLDQHVYTDFIYYLDYDYGTDVDFSNVLSKVWDDVSGVNPRRKKYLSTYRTLEEIDFVKRVRFAQNCIFTIRTKEQTPMVELGNAIQFTMPIDESWLSGLIGPVEICVMKSEYIVCLDPNDIYDRRIMYNPNKSTKTSDIPEEHRNKINEQFELKLLAGIPISNCNLLSHLKGYKVYLRDGKYVVDVNRIEYTWKELLDVTLSIQVVQSKEPSLMNSILYWEDGIVEDGFNKVVEILSNSSNSLLLSLKNHIKGNLTLIELPSIGRKGKGTEYAVRVIDVQINLLLSKIACLCPFGIRRISARKFKIMQGTFLFWLRDILNDLIVVDNLPWVSFEDKSKRQAYAFQTNVSKLISSSDRTSFVIDMPGGTGKSKVVLDTLSEINKYGKLTKYVLWAIPKSAMVQIMEEVALYGLKVNILNTNKGKTRNLDIKPKMINIILHDHFKHLDILPTIRTLSPEITLIGDEFHLAMNPTIRTTALLEISRSCALFIGLSGTPYNKKIERLIPWLEPLVSFEVSMKNIWCAVCAMISKRAKTDIVVNHHSIEASFTTEEQLKYDLLEMKLQNRDAAVFMEWVKICYTACARKQVELALEYLKIGRRSLLVAKDYKQQEEMLSMLTDSIPESKIVLVTNDNPISLTDDDKQYDVAITTVRHNTGYTATKMNVLITSVFFTDENTREQLVCRINRLSQTRDSVDVLTVHIGILSTILEEYSKHRNIRTALKSVAEIIDVPLVGFFSLQ